MQGLVGKNEPGTLLVRQTVLNQSQIQVLVASIQLVAYDRVPQVRQVNANLMFSSRIRSNTQQRERHGGWNNERIGFEEPGDEPALRLQL